MERVPAAARATSKKSKKGIQPDNPPGELALSGSLSLWNNSLVHIACIVFLILIIYGNTLNAPFQWDENSFIANNPIVKNLHYFVSPSEAKGFEFYSAFVNRYIGYLTFALNYRIHGLSVTGYHIVNIAIHIANSILVYFLVLLTFRTPFMRQGPGTRDQGSGIRDHGSRDLSLVPGPRSPVPNTIAFFSAAIFAVHPVQTEAVTYVFQRFASLVAMFYLLSLTMYIKARLWIEKRGSLTLTSTFAFTLSFISAVLAMKTKENAFTLPIIIALYEFCFFRASKRKRLFYLAPIIITLTIIPLTLMGLTGSQGLDPGSYGAKMFQRDDYLFTQFRVIVTYLRLQFFPVNQNIDYDYPVFKSFFDPQILLSFVFLSALFGLGVYLSTRQVKVEVEKGKKTIFPIPLPLPLPAFRLMGFGILWFFITLSVESSIIPIPMIIDEYRVYLPSVGVIVCVVTVAFLLKESLHSFTFFNSRLTFQISHLVLAILVLAIGSLSAATYLRNELWRDKIRLWEDTTKKSPESHIAHDNLGVAYASQGQFDRAVAEHQTALRLKPGFVRAHYNLGVAYASQGQFDRAVAEYQTALRLKPDFVQAHDNLGVAFTSQGKIDSAVAEYLAALRLKPDYAEAHNNLGIAYASRGKIDSAVAEYLTALQLKPDLADAHNNLGIAYASQGQLDSAVAESLAALQLKPDLADAHNNLGTAYASQGKLDKAIPEFEAASRLKPDLEIAHYNLGVAYATQGKLDSAILEFQAALQLKPDDHEARQRLNDVVSTRH